MFMWGHYNETDTGQNNNIFIWKTFFVTWKYLLLTNQSNKICLFFLNMIHAKCLFVQIRLHYFYSNIFPGTKCSFPWETLLFASERKVSWGNKHFACKCKINDVLYFFFFQCFLSYHNSEFKFTVQLIVTIKKGTIYIYYL